MQKYHHIQVEIWKQLFDFLQKQGSQTSIMAKLSVCDLYSIRQLFLHDNFSHFLKFIR